MLVEGLLFMLLIIGAGVIEWLGPIIDNVVSAIFIWGVRIIKLGVVGIIIFVILVILGCAKRRKK